MKKLQEKNGMILIEFPEKTGKEIVDECNNTISTGKLLWSDWMKNDDFYAKEKSRSGKRLISKELIMKGMSWKDCARSLKGDGGEMLNFAETLWFLKTYVEKFNKIPDDLNWSWSSSRSSSGSLVAVGLFDSDGVCVYGNDGPDGSDSNLGVRFSRSVTPSGAESEQDEADSNEILILESAIKICKENGLKVIKEY